MKHLVALLATALLGLGLAACGGSEKSTSTSSQTPVGAGGSTRATTNAAPAQTTPGNAPRKGTAGRGGESAGSSTLRRYPHGDNSIQTFGWRAGEAEQQAIAAVVKRYYAAVAADDGNTACSLLAPGMARSITQGFGRAPALRNKGCGGILSLLFKARPGGPSTSAAIDVTSVRLKGSHGFALLRSRATPHGEITVVREGSSWKVGALIGSSLP